MLAALKLGLDGFQLRDHSLLRSNAPHDEGSGLVALPTEVGKAQEVERLWLPNSALFTVTGRIAPELDQAVLLRVKLQDELGQSFLEVLKEPKGIGLV